jgi:FKBP-type peptidyl-prolyl cis-trans isomerase (trigger factor)
MTSEEIEQLNTKDYQQKFLTENYERIDRQSRISLIFNDITQRERIAVTSEEVEKEMERIGLKASDEENNENNNNDRYR